MTSLPGLRVAFAMIAILGIAVGAAPAQDASGWPTRPIRLVVGFGAGGGTDIAARLVAEPLAEVLGSPVVVENRPGAGGMTAADAVAKSPKDGYTALMMSNGRARYRPKDNGDEEADVDGGSAQHICGTCQCYGKKTLVHSDGCRELWPQSVDLGRGYCLATVCWGESGLS